ncbi:MAG: DNA cytosine methyltransferase [Acidimicrobiales bacterium]
MRRWDVPDARPVAALFAGIGGIELGLERAGFQTEYLCEWWEPAQSVLRNRFPGVPLTGDIEEVESLPPSFVVTAGFPCTDLSQAGMTAGIDGRNSGLVRKALSLVADHEATWVLLENVRNMLPLHGGRAMAAITRELSRMGFRWAYRLVDSRFTGVPQRRQRVILLASRTEDPRGVLFADDTGERDESLLADDAFGFYWTEGLRGLGWCRDGVPTLKGGSTIGIPSPPGIWLPEAEAGERFVTPGITTAERLQGFRKGWTAPAAGLRRGEGARWKLVGNAVTVGVSAWVGRRLVEPGPWDASLSTPLPSGTSWPTAAWGEGGKAWRVDVSLWPERRPYKHILGVMGDDCVSLSHRAAAGFLDRLDRGTLRVPDQFRLDMKEHVEVTRNQ